MDTQNHAQMYPPPPRPLLLPLFSPRSLMRLSPQALRMTHTPLALFPPCLHHNLNHRPYPSKPTLNLRIVLHSNENQPLKPPNPYHLPRRKGPIQRHRRNSPSLLHRQLLIVGMWTDRDHPMSCLRPPLIRVRAGPPLRLFQLSTTLIDPRMS